MACGIDIEPDAPAAFHGRRGIIYPQKQADEAIARIHRPASQIRFAPSVGYPYTKRLCLSAVLP